MGILCRSRRDSRADPRLAGKARDGCIWFIDWFQIADNPKFTSQATDCPF